MLYNNKPISLEGCKEFEREGGFCPVEKFLEIAHNSIPKNFEAECQSLNK